MLAKQINHTDYFPSIDIDGYGIIDGIQNDGHVARKEYIEHTM